MKSAWMPGANGTLVLGGVPLAWILGWATMRLARRPRRTIRQAEPTG